MWDTIVGWSLNGGIQRFLSPKTSGLRPLWQLWKKPSLKPEQKIWKDSHKEAQRITVPMHGRKPLETPKNSLEKFKDKLEFLKSVWLPIQKHVQKNSWVSLFMTLFLAQHNVPLNYIFKILNYIKNNRKVLLIPKTSRIICFANI